MVFSVPLHCTLFSHICVKEERGVGRSEGEGDGRELSDGRRTEGVGDGRKKKEKGER